MMGKRQLTFPLVIAGFGILFLAACGDDAAEAVPASATSIAAVSTVSSSGEPTESATPATTPVPANPDAVSREADPAPDDSAYLLFNQRWLEGILDESLDLEDIDAVFWRVFSGLPDEITVYPSENYYYYTLYVNGRQLWGNIRLPAGRRENGVLSFAYFEFKESPFQTEPRLSRSKYFLDRDGLTIEEVDRFTFKVRYRGKEVIFHLHELSLAPPNLFPLGEDEVFIERTFDESGYQFFLLFDERDNFFFWVLNEEEQVPDILESLEDDLLVGRRSGFAFWIDEAHGNRKILAAIRGQSATRNDYYDGPFDQLADNYVDENRISEYMVKVSPGLEGRIDKYGYFTDRESGRVSISPYYVYFTLSSLRAFLEEAKQTEDPYAFISRGRRAPVEGS